MITEISMSQIKYKLLINSQQSQWKTQIFYFVVILLIIGTVCTWIGISIPKIFYVQTLEELNQEEKTLARTWLHKPQMHARTMKENHHGANKNINVDLEWQFNDSTEKFIVCYYTVPKTSDMAWNLSPSRIDPHICTHIIVGFASITNCTVDMGVDTKIYEEVVNLKKNNSKLKVMFSVGGGNELNSGFPEMVKNHANRKRFISSVLNVTKKFGFDGLDLDWEFPALFEPKEKEKIHFVQLLYEVRKEFDRRSEKLILSVAAAAPQVIIDQSYDVPEIAEHVDFINLMSYDYHYYVWYFPVTDLNAPLFPHVMESGYLDTLNVNFSANYWATKRMPRYKIVVGIPTYGHSYKLDNPLNHKLQAPANGFGKLGLNGFVSYSTICQFLKDGASNVFVNKSKVPYAYRNEEWISYDDNESIYYKTKWILANGFKGAMIFSLNTDDWNNECNTNESFPLTRTITKLFEKTKIKEVNNFK